jgi:hypothetical protein
MDFDVGRLRGGASRANSPLGFSDQSHRHHAQQSSSTGYQASGGYAQGVQGSPQGVQGVQGGPQGQHRRPQSQPMPHPVPHQAVQQQQHWNSPRNNQVQAQLGRAQQNFHHNPANVGQHNPQAFNQTFPDNFEHGGSLQGVPFVQPNTRPYGGSSYGGGGW